MPALPVNDHLILLTDGTLESDANIGTVAIQKLRIKAQIAKAVQDDKPLVVYLHGGLVKQTSGMASANRVAVNIENGGGIPLSLIWPTGILEVIQNNLDEIFDKKFYKWLFKKLLRKVGGRITSQAFDLVGGARSATASTENFDIEQQIQFENELRNDADLDLTVNALALAASQAAPDAKVADSHQFRSLASTSADIDPEAAYLLQTLPSDFFLEKEVGSSGNPRGLLGAAAMKAKLIKAVVKIAIGVYRRYRGDTHHTLHATIMEEILRGLKLNRVAEKIWGLMKQDTDDAFGPADDNCAGTLLLDALKASPHKPRVVLLGHSAGCVFASNLLRYATEGSFDLIFLAPAVTYEHFDETLQTSANRIANFRMFAMKDGKERSDTLVGEIQILYPSSLLYFVAGVCEADASGHSEVDKPILGMQRYWSTDYEPDRDTAQAAERIRTFINQTDHVFWSETPSGNALGMRSGSLDHGHFDDEDPLTIESYTHLIESGF